MRWCHAEVTRFLEGYKSLPCLWDPVHQDYKNKIARDLAMETLKNHVACGDTKLTTKCVKDKIKGVRTTYSDELNKIITTNGEYVPKVFWFKLADSFLREVIEGKKKKLEYPYPDDYSTDYGREEQNESNVEYGSYQSSSYSTHTGAHVSQPMLNAVREDEFELFGRSMALQLRKLPELDALDLMQKMQLLVNNKKQYLKTEQTIMAASKQSSNGLSHVNDTELPVSQANVAAEESADEDNETYVFRLKTECKDDQTQRFTDPLSVKRMKF